MASLSCATCAQAYNNPQDPASEKPLLPGRHLDCCNRSICSRCLNQNKRYETYCPYCQISSAPTPLPQGLREPPAYSSLADFAIPPPPDTDEHSDLPPPYSSNSISTSTDEKGQASQEAPDVLHFLTPDDSIRSLSLAYGVPAHALRKTNSIYSDHLVQGRKTVLIPGEYYKGGVSLSPRPIEGEEEETKKMKIRRWMVACKVSEYDVALLYLKQEEWDLDAAIQAYGEDERWEKEHPMQEKHIKKGKSAKQVGMRRFVGDARQSAS